MKRLTLIATVLAVLSMLTMNTCFASANIERPAIFTKKIYDNKDSISINCPVHDRKDRAEQLLICDLEIVVSHARKKLQINFSAHNLEPLATRVRLFAYEDDLHYFQFLTDVQCDESLDKLIPTAAVQANCEALFVFGNGKLSFESIHITPTYEEIYRYNRK